MRSSSLARHSLHDDHGHIVFLRSRLAKSREGFGYGGRYFLRRLVAVETDDTAQTVHSIHLALLILLLPDSVRPQEQDLGAIPTGVCILPE